MTSQAPEVKERDLVEKVELRFALAESPKDFEQTLDTFLAPLLLKLASPYASVRQLVFNALKDILSRLNTLKDLKIPVKKLVRQAQHIPGGVNDSNGNVKLYSLLLASKGIERLGDAEVLPLLCIVMKGISQLPGTASARMFHVLCKLLLRWTPPTQDLKHEEEIQKLLKLEDEEDLTFLLEKFTAFFLLVPAKVAAQPGIIPRGYTCPGLTAKDVSFFTYDAGVTFKKDQMISFKKAILSFLSFGLALKDYRMIKFLIVASSDPSDVSEKATQSLKKFNIPYENDIFINGLVSLFRGNKERGRPPVKHELQEKILSILNRSLKATENTTTVSIVCSIGMNSQHYRLKSLCLEFIRHVARHNYHNLPKQSSSNDFSMSVTSLIKSDLQSQGWPTLQVSATTQDFKKSISQRRMEYETLGEILKRDETLLHDMSYINFLFDSLKGDLPEFRSSIQECLTSLSINLHKMPSQSKEELRQIIRRNLQDDFELGNAENIELKNTIMASRLVCIKYTNSAFPFHDAEARLFNIWGTARTNRFDIIEESYKGLHPYWFRLDHAARTQEYASVKGILASDVKEILLPPFDIYTELLLKQTQENLELPSACIWKTLGTAVRFAKQCLISQSVYGKKTAVLQDEDWSIRVENAIRLDDRLPQAIRDKIAVVDSDWFESFLNLLCGEFTIKDQNNNKVSNSLYSDQIFGELLLFLLRYCDEKKLSSFHSMIPSLFNYIQAFETSQEAEMEIAANALGIICAAGKGSPNVEFVLNSLQVGKPTQDELPSVLANAFVLPRLFVKGHFGDLERAKLTLLISKLHFHLLSSKHKFIINKSIGELSKFDVFKDLDEEKAKPFISDFVDHNRNLLANNQSATETWGYLSLCTSQDKEFEVFFEGIFETHASKQIDYLFSAGEAISVIAGGWNSKFLYQQLDVPDVSLTKLQEHFPQERISYALNRLLNACDSTKPSLRKASCIWVLSLIQYLGKSERISSRCNEIHQRLMRFLGDHDEFVQESAARGLSMIYEIGNTDLKEEMVKGLLRSFTDSTKAMNISSGTVGADTELFEDNMLKTDDGSVRTYKDILNLASEVGDPALVYKFMSLSKSSSLWASKKGIAFGLGAIMSKSSLQNLLLENETIADRLIPKIFRYKFDPYPNVARSMNDIWNVLIEDPNTTLNRYLDKICAELLQGMSNKEWRVREASTTALLHVIQTQPQDKLSSQLLEIWTMAFRTMDDIKESVRSAGTNLTKSLARILVASINVNEGASSEKSKLLLEHILPFLLGTKGLNGDAEEVRNFALKTVIDLVKNAGEVIKPFTVQLVFEFTLLFSSIEPQVINYLSLNAAKYNVDAETIDLHRQNGVTVSPLFEAIDTLIKKSDETMVKQHVDSAIKATKKSVGLPSKIAAAGVLNLLVGRYSNSLTPYCGKLLKLCITSFRDRNDSVKSAFAKSFGYLYRVAPTEKAGKYADLLCQMYFESEEMGLKRIVAIAIEAVLKQAPSQFENISSSFMPLLFVASNDAERPVRQAFEKVWREASKSGKSTVRLYLEEIMDLLKTNIKSSSFTTRRTCSTSMTILCEISDETIRPAQISQMFEIVLVSLRGRSWEGKESLLDALQSLVVKFTEFVSNNSDLKKSICEAFDTELNRKNIAYVKKAAIPFCGLVTTFPEDALIRRLIEVVTSVTDVTRDSESLDHEPNDNYSKRLKTDSDLNRKSSRQNIDQEEYTVNILKLCAKVCRQSRTWDEDVISLFKVMINKLLELFENKGIHYTWRSQIAACEIGSIAIESYAERPPNQSIEESMKEFWHQVFDRNITNDSIENVKIQTIKFGGKLMQNMPALRGIIKTDLKKMDVSELSSKIESELKNVEAIS